MGTYDERHMDMRWYRRMIGCGPVAIWFQLQKENPRVRKMKTDFNCFILLSCH